MSLVQSILFDRKKWNLTNIKKWLKLNNFKYFKNDKTINYIRIRQVDPNDLKGYQFKAKKLNEGIIFIIAYKSKKGGKIEAKIAQNIIEQTYHDNPESVDDYIYDPEISKSTGAVYHNPKLNHTVVSHRGTKGLMDWGNNLAYVTGLYNYTNRYKQGKEIQEEAEKKYGTSNLTNLSHSQGSILARKLGKNANEIINVNPAYLGEIPNKNEYNIRSSSDIVSALYKPVSWLNKNSITVPSKSWFNILGEHKPEILSRLDPHRMIGGFIMSHIGQSPTLHY